MSLHKQNKSGFTLIELLVVVTLIGILAGILLPTLAAARERARIGDAKSTIKGLDQACRQYETDFGVFPPEEAPAAPVGGAQPHSTTSLVIFLDGDESTTTANGGGAGARTNYYEFSQKALFYSAPANSQYCDPWGNPSGGTVADRHPYYYRELAQENLGTKTVTNDPRSDNFNIRGFQIFSTAGTAVDIPLNDDRAAQDWITNYR